MGRITDGMRAAALIVLVAVVSLAVGFWLGLECSGRYRLVHESDNLLRWYLVDTRTGEVFQGKGDSMTPVTTLGRPVDPFIRSLAEPEGDYLDNLEDWVREEDE